MLSYRTAVDLNTIKLMEEAREVLVVNQDRQQAVRPSLSQPSKERIEAIRAWFPELFSGKVGCI